MKKIFYTKIVHVFDDSLDFPAVMYSVKITMLFGFVIDRQIL